MSIKGCRKRYLASEMCLRENIPSSKGKAVMQAGKRRGNMPRVPQLTARRAVEGYNRMGLLFLKEQLSNRAGLPILRIL